MRRYNRYLLRFFYGSIALSLAIYLSYICLVNRQFLPLVLVVNFLVSTYIFLIENYLLENRSLKETSRKSHNNSDVLVFVDEEDIETVRIALISLQNLKASNDPIVICSKGRDEVQILCNELKFKCVSSLQDVSFVSDFVLVTNGHSVIYPDAITVARRRFNVDIDTVELNHSKGAIHKIRETDNLNDPSVSTRLSKALGSQGILLFNGGPLLLRRGAFSKALNCESSKGINTFVDFISCYLSSSVRGTITAHACCECLSGNELDQNIAARAIKFKVSRGIKKSPKSTKTDYRQRLVMHYRFLIDFRILNLGFIALAIPGVLLFALPVHEISPFVFLGVGALLLTSKILHNSVGDNRKLSSKIRDVLFDMEAYLKSHQRKKISQSRKAKYKFQVGVIYVIVLALLLILSLIIQVFNNDSDLMASVVGPSLILALFLIAYSASDVFFSAQQRAFMRRKVSIPGSSSYESMWIVDLTHRGAAYISDSKIELGEETPLVFRIPGLDKDSLVTVVGRVTYCGVRGDQYQIGVEFKEVPFDVRDQLISYCSVIYPYTQARNIADVYKTPRNILGKYRYGLTKDPVALCVNLLSVFAILLLMSSFVPTQNDPSSNSQVFPSSINADFKNSISSEYSSPVVNENFDWVNSSSQAAGTVPLEVLAPNEGPKLVVKSELLEVPPNAFSRGDTVKIRINVSNSGDLVANEGYKVQASLPDGLRRSSLRLVASQGFVPCGFSGMELECISGVALNSGESKAIELHAISDIEASTNSEGKMISVSAFLSRADSKFRSNETSIDSQNRHDQVIPVGSGVSIGSRVFFDRNGDGTHTGGEHGIPGVLVTLLRFDDKNKNGIVDLGEATRVTSDIADSKGFFGVAKATSSFMNLASGSSYALQYSQIPKGYLVTSQGLVLNNPAEQGIEDFSVGEEFTQETYQSPWVALGPNEVNTNTSIGLRKKPRDIKTQLVLKKANAETDIGSALLAEQEVRLLRWVDRNRNEKIDSSEVTTRPVASKISDSQGQITFSEMRDDYFPTKFAFQISQISQLSPPDSFIVGNVPSLSSQIGKFERSRELSSIDEHIFEIRNSTIKGKLWADVNQNFEVDPLERGVKSVQIALLSESREVLKIVRSTKNGTFEFKNISQGQYYLGVVKKSLPKGYVVSSFGTIEIADGVIGSLNKIEIKPASALILNNISLAPTANISGLAIAEDKGVNNTAIISGAKVSLISLENIIVAKTKSDKNGRYGFEGIKVGVYEVQINGDKTNRSSQAVVPGNNEVVSQAVVKDQSQFKTAALSALEADWDGVFLFESDLNNIELGFILILAIVWVMMVTILAYRRKIFRKI